MTGQRDVETGEVSLHLRRTGSGAPLLLLHGLTDSGAVWQRVAGALSGRFDIVAPDARGHGRSSRVVDGTGVESLADDAAAVVRCEFGVPAAVWGHSMGATTAVELAATHPGLVDRLVLEDPPFAAPPPEGDGTGGSDGLEGLRRMVRDVRAAADRLAHARAANPDWHESELPGWVESKLELDEAVLARRMAAAVDWRDLMGRVRAPVLLLTGAPERGAAVTSAVAAELVALHPDTVVRRFGGAGHNVRREAHDGVLAAVQEFLERSV